MVSASASAILVDVPPLAACQVATPVASLVNTLPAPAPLVNLSVSVTVNSPFTKSIGIFFDPTYLFINGIKVEGEYFFIAKIWPREVKGTNI